MKYFFLLVFVSSILFSQAQVGVGVSASDISSSAQLEVKSVTRGFLPPRMTAAQRNAIATPVAGLVLWCSNCGSNGELQVYNGTAWTNMIGGAASSPPLVVGQTALGGVVAYILQSGDPGYDANIQHGLIISISHRNAANGSTKVTSEWGCVGTAISGADATAIGSGNQNTLDILAGCTTAGIAAKICADLVEGGYSDWYLPSKDELYKVFLNRASIGLTSLDAFWSSSEVNGNDAWVVEFNAQNIQQVWKGYTNYSVLAIRSF